MPKRPRMNSVLSALAGKMTFVKVAAESAPFSFTRSAISGLLGGS